MPANNWPTATSWPGATAWPSATNWPGSGGGSGGTIADASIYDRGPKGTWILPSAAPAYYIDSWHKVRFQAGITNPNVQVTGIRQANGTAQVHFYVNGTYSTTASSVVADGGGNPIVLGAIVTCGPTDVIELRAGAQFTLTAVSPASFLAPPTAPAKRLIIVADSIGQGYNASPDYLCWANLLVDDPPGASWRVTNMAFTGNTASNFGNNTAADALAARILARCDGTTKNVVWLALGINDWNGGITAATYSTVYNVMVARLRLAIPSIGLALASQLIVGTNDTALNPASQTAASFRAVVLATAGGLGDCAYVDGLPIMTNADEADGTTHPNNAGMVKYKNVAKPAILAQWGA